MSYLLNVDYMYFMSHIEYAVVMDVIRKSAGSIDFKDIVSWSSPNIFSIIFEGQIPLEVLKSIKENYAYDSCDFRVYEDENDIILRIGTKKLLLIFLIEMNHNFGVNDLSEKYDELMSQINLELLQKWIQNNKYDNIVYKYCTEVDKECELRRILMSFDKTMVPFFESDSKTDDIINACSKELDINVEDIKRPHALIISDKNKNSYISYRRNDGIEFQLIYKPDDVQTKEISHLISLERETVIINYYDGDRELTLSLEYNISEGTITTKEGFSIEEEQIEFVRTELLNAIEYAENEMFKGIVQKGRPLSKFAH